MAAATACAFSGESVSTTVGVWYDCSTASTCESQYAAPSVSPFRLPSWRKSYWIGWRTKRHMPQTEPATISADVAITQPVWWVSAVAYGPATQPMMRDRFLSRSGRTRSAMAMSGGMRR